MLTWIRFPDGGSMAGEFSGPLRAGIIVIIDAAEYVIEEVGQIATDETPRSRRYGKARQFVPVAYLKARAGSERAVTGSGRIDARARRDRKRDASANHG
jgi:hypothetical protein